MPRLPAATYRPTHSEIPLDAHESAGTVRDMEPAKPATDASSRWDRRWARRSESTVAAAFVVDSGRFLPRSGRALDVAGGAGRHAVWLAERGLTVTLVDVSQVALDRAKQLAAGRRVRLRTVQRDLEADGLVAGQWEVVLIHHFLDRAVLASAPDALERGGVLIFCQATSRNLERHDRPGPQFLLEEGELADVISGWSLEVLVLEESWGVEGRHEARFVGRRPLA